MLWDHTDDFYDANTWNGVVESDAGDLFLSGEWNEGGWRRGYIGRMKTNGGGVNSYDSFYHKSGVSNRNVYTGGFLYNGKFKNYGFTFYNDIVYWQLDIFESADLSWEALWYYDKPSMEWSPYASFDETLETEHLEAIDGYFLVWNYRDLSGRNLVYLAKLDFADDYIFTKEFRGGGNFKMHAVSKAADGMMLAGAERDPEAINPRTSVGIVHKLNPQAELEWSFEYGEADQWTETLYAEEIGEQIEVVALSGSTESEFSLLHFSLDQQGKIMTK